MTRQRHHENAQTHGIGAACSCSSVLNRKDAGRGGDDLSLDRRAWQDPLRRACTREVSEDGQACDHRQLKPNPSSAARGSRASYPAEEPRISDRKRSVAAQIHADAGSGFGGSASQATRTGSQRSNRLRDMVTLVPREPRLFRSVPNDAGRDARRGVHLLHTRRTTTQSLPIASIRRAAVRRDGSAGACDSLPTRNPMPRCLSVR